MGGVEDLGQVEAKRSEDLCMDPCFRFLWADLKDLFPSATMVDAMLVALEHMQVDLVKILSGLTKFRWNTLSFPQDLGGFARRQQVMKKCRLFCLESGYFRVRLGRTLGLLRDCFGRISRVRCAILKRARA